MKNVKRLSLRALSLLLTLILVLSTVPMTVFATEADSAETTDDELPNATVSVLEPMMLETGGYQLYDGSLHEGTIDRPLQVVMNFKANDTEEEALASKYGKYACDFYLTFSGIENFTAKENDDDEENTLLQATGCYLAGKYGDEGAYASLGWLVIPVDGLAVGNGVEYPVVSTFDPNLTYANICDYVKEFTAAIYIAPEILDANPDFTVSLALKMTNPDDANDVLVIGEPATYTVADLSLQSAINATENGGTIKLENDVTLLEGVTVPAGKEITLDLNGHTIKQVKECTASYEMINNKGKLTITGNGKISFTDTGAGDAAATWGSYTIRNNGTLVVENGIIENLSAQNVKGSAFAHTALAIYQYSGSTTINGGTISTPNYRSVRLWSGDMTLNGGTFDGQVWVQCVNNTAKMTINGGDFSPNWNDGSSVFVNNSGYTAEFTVTGGNFSTKIGANDADALAGAITGGTFTESAKTNTNSALIAEGYEFVENNGKYVVIASDIKEVVDNTEFGDENADVVANAKAELEELVGEELDDAEITSEIKVGLSNVTTDGEGKVTSITFDVTPQLVAGEHSVKIANFAEAITFRLPVPASVSEAYAKIYHGVEYIGTYAVEEDENGKYVEVSSKTFSEYSAEFVDLDPKGEVNDAFTSVDGRIWGDWSGNASESFVVKIYSGDTYMGYTSLNNVGGIINGEYKTLTWHIDLDPSTDTDEYWKSEWEIKPALDCMPTTAALYIDGVYIGEAEIQLNCSDSIFKLYAAVADADGVIKGYAYTLQNAFDAVEEGGTILLVRDVTITKDTIGYTDGNWIDGVRYTGDKSFTVDFNGHTVTDDGCVNDYVLYVNNKGEKENEVTFKNGTVKGGANIWNVICVSSDASKYKTTLNLKDITVIGDSSKNSGEDGVVKVRKTSVINILSGTVITSENAMYCVQATSSGATVNIYEGSVINMNFVRGAAVSGVGMNNIYGGTINAVDGASAIYTSTSGTPKIIVSGGTINGDVVSSADINSYPTANPSIVINGNAVINGNVTAIAFGTTNETNGAEVVIEGGKITGNVTATAGNYIEINDGVIEGTVSGNSGDVVVAGGTFSNEIPEDLCADGFVPTLNEDGTYGVVEANYVAEVNGTKYETLAEAFANANGYTVKLLADIATDTTITIASGAVVTLDLNGYTITGTDTTTKNFGLFNNVGTFTVKDSVGGGKITLTATNDNGWDRYSAVISNNPGGNLTIESGIIEHLGGTRMAYGIDNLTNGKGTSAVVTVNGGTVISAYIGIRQFLNGIEATNKLTINGGTVTGANSAIYFQSPSARANTGTLIIGGEAEIGKRIYLGITDGTTEWPVEISIDSAALAEGVEVVSDPIPEGYELKTENGVIGVIEKNYVAEVNGVKYETVTEAINAANDGDTVYLLAGTITEYVAPWIKDSTHKIEKSITIVGAADFGTVMTGGMYLGYDDSGCRDHTVTVKGIHFVGNGLDVAGQKYVVIEGNKFTDITSQFAIAVKGKNINATVKDNYIEDADSVGIEVRNAISATVTGNTVKNTGHNSVQITAMSDGAKAVIADNYFENWGTSGEGRALRTAGTNTVVTANGNAMIHENAPEQFAKLTDVTEVDVSDNYWSGNDPTADGIFLSDLNVYEAVDTYYTDVEMTESVEIVKLGAVMIGDAFYASVTEALDYIFENYITEATIKLITNTEIARGRETIPHGITLDLNGYTLTTRYLSVDGCIIDSSEAKTGLLVIAKDNLTIRDVDGVHTHTYMPVYNEEGTGYIFVEIKAQIEDVDASDDGTNISFEFRPGFIDRDTTKAYFSDGAADNGLTFEVHATWSNGEKDNKIVISEELIQSVYQGDKMISFTLSNVSTEITDLTLSVVIVSESGVTISTVAYPPVNA